MKRFSLAILLSTSILLVLTTSAKAEPLDNQAPAQNRSQPVELPANLPAVRTTPQSDSQVEATPLRPEAGTTESEATKNQLSKESDKSTQNKSPSDLKVDPHCLKTIQQEARNQLFKEQMMIEEYRRRIGDNPEDWQSRRKLAKILWSRGFMLAFIAPKLIPAHSGAERQNELDKEAASYITKAIVLLNDDTLPDSKLRVKQYQAMIELLKKGEFDKTIWEQNPDSLVRYFLARYLEHSKKLLGMEASQIIDMLGTPKVNTESHISYVLEDSHAGVLGYLFVYFKEGKASAQYVYTDKLAQFALYEPDTGNK